MTSFIIKAHEKRPLPASWAGTSSADCPFCRIVRGEGRAFKVYEDEMVVAVLDILPLRPGHTLVIPKTHISRVSELPPEFAAATGVAVSKVARALAEALDNTGLNVVCNQEYAQAVPHVHYHIIPAPKFDVPAPEAFKGDHVATALTEKEMHKLEIESRNELDDDVAKKILEMVHARL